MPKKILLVDDEPLILKGLKYSLSEACLTSTVPLGVSNEFVGEKSHISAENGILMVMWNEDAKSFMGRIR